MEYKAFLAVSNGKRWTAVCAVVVAMAISMAAQITARPNRITQNLTSGPIVKMAGMVHPLTQRASDMGAVDSEMQMDAVTLNIGLTAAQQTELKGLLDAQQDPNSSLYHQWLTQEQYGARFGLTDEDLNKVTSWLNAQGLKVKSVANSRNAITFGGKAWQVESAFHTQLHKYALDGETHFANATDLRVPAGLGSVLLTVRGLDNFRPKAKVQKLTPTPQFTTHSGTHFITPGDWVKIYDMAPIYNAGYTGTGMHVGVVGQTYVPQDDIDHFRSAAGLSTTKLNYHCISSADCTDAAGTSTDGDLMESDLDIELAGSIAKNATVDFIYASHSDANQDAFDAMRYAVQSYQVGGAVVPVLSASYGTCEQAITTGNATWFLNIAQQANAQGQTIVVSSGDSGAAGCDPHDDSSVVSTSLGLSADVPADVPNITGVGGTVLNDYSDPSAYWNSSTSTTTTALSYIPETSWNESSSDGLIAGGGGVSTFFIQPSWQTAPSNFTGSAGRFVPDVSFTASWNHDGYLICTPNYDVKSGTSCTNGFLSSTDYIFFAGGTSAGAPSFAGILTLLTQKFGPLGNVNPTLYALAAKASTYNTVFHDITTGNNQVPCTTGAVGCVNGEVGYQATSGYDLVTGLGSIDAGALLTAMTSESNLATTTTTVSATPISPTMGSTTSLTASVSSTTAGTISGTIVFANGDTKLGSSTISNGTATLSGVQITPANGFVASTRSLITANYDGDTTFGTSIGNETLTPAALPATTTAVTATPNSLVVGSATTLTATITSSTAGAISGAVTFKIGAVTIGTATATSGTATLNTFTTSSNGFMIGSNIIAASYGGDPLNYAASSGTTTLTVVDTPSTTTTVTASPNSLTAGGTTNLTATVTSTGSGTIKGIVNFIANNNALLGTATVTSGTATLDNVTVNAAHYFMIGTNPVTASFISADANFAASTGATTITMVGLPTKTVVTVTPTSVLINGTMSLSVSATPAVPNSYVSFQTTAGVSPFGSLALSSNGTDTLSGVLANAANGFSIGTNTIVASLNANGDYAASSGTTTVTATPQPATTTTVTATPNSVLIDGTTTLTATVTSATAGTPTGTIRFLNGANYVAGAQLSNGTATLPNISLEKYGFTIGTDSITASYSGDTNFAASSGTTTLTVGAGPSYTLVPSATAVSASAGGSATVTLNLASTNYAGIVTFATSVSSGVISASAPSVTLTSGGTGSTTLTITATTSAANRAPSVPWKSGGALVFVALVGVPITRRSRKGLAILLMMVAISAVGFMVACSGGSSAAAPKSPRTYTVVVTPTGNGTVANASATTITVTVQ